MNSIRLVLIEDERLLARSIHRFLSERYECEWFETVEQAVVYLRKESVDLVISDVQLPKKSGIDLLNWVLENQPHLAVILVTAFSSVKEAVEAMRKGACDYMSKPLDLEALELTIERTLKNRRLQNEVLYHRQQKYSGKGDYLQLPSQKFEQIEMMLQRLVEIEHQTGELPSVLITGETGTGKGSLARRLHQQSPRSEEAFIEINSTAIPETMVETELFGHEKGAFTGAVGQRVGLFELANGGTLFLDEIGHLSLGIQAKLLKVIEDKKLRRVGGNREISVNVRVVAATNVGLEEAVSQGLFRDDLYHRLGLVHLKLPALRETPETIRVLADYYMQLALRKYPANHTGLYSHPTNTEISLGISRRGYDVLSHYSWPGNIRELKNEMERCVLFNSGGSLDFEHLQLMVQNQKPLIKNLSQFSANTETTSSDELSRPPFQLPSEGLSLLNVEPQLIGQAVYQSSGDLNSAAKLLKMTLEELRYRIQKHGLGAENSQLWHHPLPDEGISIAEIEKDFLCQALERTGNNVTGAARLLNLSRDQMRYRLEKHDINT
ncbi:MAG: sigma 54-interacting transcriptional regulator [SAR324 cluster bacterium]|nr:sigma 54-interacting transcriptional regulator [SAR324 cluster bacterium]MBL7034756.1 sigma 54-interacting transcriptional regulator [SAR324 cluster bacterium]